MSDEPIVTIIICNHLSENEKYLNEAIASVWGSCVAFKGNEEFFFISDAERIPVYPPGFFFKTVHSFGLDTFGKKIAHAFEIMAPSSKGVLIVSDDIILSKNTLNELLQAGVFEDNFPCIVNPISNSDIGTRVANGMFLKNDLGENVSILPCHTYEEGISVKDAVLNYKTEQFWAFKTDWVGFHCTYIPRHVWERVGLMDPKLSARFEDQDYCVRAARLGFISVIHTGCFAFHFGSKTITKSYTKEDFRNSSIAFSEKYELNFTEAQLTLMEPKEYKQASS